MKNEPRFAMYTISAKNFIGKHEAKLKIPFSLTNLRSCLARSMFLTMYKPLDTFIFVTLEEDAYDLLERHKKAFDIINDCQTIFAESIKDIPYGVYTVGQVQITTEDLSFVRKSNFLDVDNLCYAAQTKLMWKKQLEKAAIIVEGMLQYKFQGMFTDDCLALIDEYKATKMLEG